MIENSRIQADFLAAFFALFIFKRSERNESVFTLISERSAENKEYLVSLLQGLRVSEANSTESPELALE